MKTTKSVERSPMQMTIVAFALLFLVITATILFMYFKWFANDELGAPAAVNMVEKNNIQDQSLLPLTDAELFQNLYGYREWPQDKIDLIKTTDDCQVLGSMLSNAGDQLVYFEKCGDISNIILMDLMTSKETILYTKEIVNNGYDTFDYVPWEWSPLDKKIILYKMIGSVDGGNSSGEPTRRIIDVKSAKDESLPPGDGLIGFVVGKNGEENLIYLSEISKAVCINLMGPYTKLIQKNSDNGKEVVLVENEIGIYVYLNDSGKIVLKEAIPTQEVPEANCIDSEMGPEQIIELK